VVVAVELVGVTGLLVGLVVVQVQEILVSLVEREIRQAHLQVKEITVVLALVTRVAVVAELEPLGKTHLQPVLLVLVEVVQRHPLLVHLFFTLVVAVVEVFLFILVVVVLAVVAVEQAITETEEVGALTLVVVVVVELLTAHRDSEHLAQVVLAL
jgi:hypothetical protein